MDQIMPAIHSDIDSGSRSRVSAVLPVSVQERPSTLEVSEVSVYRGPNIYTLLPMIRIQVALGALEELPTTSLGDFTAQLLQLLPGLHQHGCCYEKPGGFVLRLEEGTWIGHVVEHVALELQKLAGAPVSRGKTRSTKGRPGVYDVLYEYEIEEVGLAAGLFGLKLVEQLLPPSLRGLSGADFIDDWLPTEFQQRVSTAADLEAWIGVLRAQRSQKALGPTTAALVAEARRLGIPVCRLDNSSLVQLGHGKNQRRIWAAMTSSTSQIGVDIAADKDLTKALLEGVGLPVPAGVVIHAAEELAGLTETMRIPLVTKPLCGNHGRGVTLNIRDMGDLQRGFAAANAISKSVVVEEQFAGKDYRILVVAGEVVAAAHRLPAHVIGDGKSSIAELIAIENKDPRRGEGHENVMTKIEVDETVLERLKRSGLSLESIPASRQQVFLRETGNMSTGGTATDCTDVIHPDNVQIAKRAALAVGLDVAGIDFIAPDISKSVFETGGGIVEINAAPGLRMHMAPSSGNPRPVAQAIIDTIFPTGQDGRIPIFALTGTNGKSTTALMLAAILKKAGFTVGLTNTSGVFIDGRQIQKADAAGPKSARAILRDATVDAAVLETARGGIVREGLGFEDCDVGAVLNVDVDHLGLRSVDTVDDLAWAKSLVVEVVHRRGVSVLNADNVHTRKMAGRAGGKVIYFSLRGDNMPRCLAEHIADGGTAIVRSNRWKDELLIYDRGRKKPLLAIADIPTALNGAAEFNVANAMAAAAMAYGYGVDLACIRAGLSSFTNLDNPGRLNICDDHGFRVIVDYGHNQASLRALGKVVSALADKYDNVIGMLGMPGDRRDVDLREMGALAAQYFDHIVLRETPDQRGRPPGEMNKLMEEGAVSVGFPKQDITKFLEEFDAVRHCLDTARDGDLVVLMATRYQEVWNIVKSYRRISGARQNASSQEWQTAPGH